MYTQEYWYQYNLSEDIYHAYAVCTVKNLLDFLLNTNGNKKFCT